MHSNLSLAEGRGCDRRCTTNVIKGSGMGLLV